MQVILTVDVKGRGKKGDIIDVNPSFAQNVLLKNNQAVLATKSSLNDHKGKQEAKEFHHSELVAEFEKTKTEMLSKHFEINLKIGANGKAFGSITKQEVINCFAKYGFTIAKNQIDDFEPIRTLGNYTIGLTLIKEVKFQLTIEVK